MASPRPYIRALAGALASALAWAPSGPVETTGALARRRQYRTDMDGSRLRMTQVAIGRPRARARG